jgi:hypothetical protein
MAWCMLFCFLIAAAIGQIIPIGSTCELQSTRNGTNFLSLQATTNCSCGGIEFPSYLLNSSNTNQLVTLNLTGCNFSGKIFSYVNVTSLKNVDLSGNNFTEEFPQSYFNDDLTTFNIDNNNLYGTVPFNFRFRKNLTLVILRNNSLTGEFDSVLVNAFNIKKYSVAGNKFYYYKSDLDDVSFKDFRPTYINERGFKEGLAQIDCVFVKKGAAVPNWCTQIDKYNGKDEHYRCTCERQCGNGFVEDGEECDGGECCDNCKIVSDYPHNPCKVSNSSCAFYACAVGACVWAGNKNNDSVCRPATDLCDIAEYCDGKRLDCPEDKLYGPDKTCRDVNGTCDKAEKCDGIHTYCPLDEYYGPEMTCRNVNGTCDVAENCTSYSPHCPADTFASPNQTCRPSIGPCDISEQCTGRTSQCPEDRFLQPSTICNQSKCFVDALCGNGILGQCPDMIKKSCSDGGVCNLSTGDCECKNQLLTYPNCVGCGDRHCDPSLENCVNCPADCGSPCNLCGDSACGTNETCGNCYQDCCSESDCIPPCVHGYCKEASCVCHNLYTGPTCNADSLPIHVNNSDSSPVVSVRVQGLASTDFSISLSHIYEKDSAGDIWNPVNLTNTEFLLTTSVTSNYLFWNYTAQIFMRTSLQIYVFHFNKPDNFTFSGSTTEVGANTIKLAIFISDWPFRATQNALFVNFENSIATSSAMQGLQPCAIEKRENSNNDLRWYKVTVGGVTMYSQMEDEAIVDGYVKPITFAYSSATTFAARIPFFWNNVTVDPNFSVLVEDSDPCRNSDKPPKWNWFYIIPIFVVVPVCGLLFWKYEILKRAISLRTSPKLVIELDETHTTTASVDLE